MNNVTLKIAASLLVVLAAARPAAADLKQYPGLGCLASGAAILDVSRDGSGAATNPTTTSVDFICPVVRDLTSIASAKMYVYDRRSDASVICTIMQGRAGGTQLTFTTEATSVAAASSTAAYTLSFESLPGGSGAFYWFTCTVPGLSGDGQSSGIATYSVTEA